MHLNRSVEFWCMQRAAEANPASTRHASPAGFEEKKNEGLDLTHPTGPGRID
jgi:hypothetical protein